MSDQLPLFAIWRIENLMKLSASNIDVTKNKDLRKNIAEFGYPYLKKIQQPNWLYSSVNEENVGIVPRAVKQLFNGITKRQEEARESGLPPPEFKG